MAGDYGLPQEAWEKYDEPYKQTYPEYVKIQREKDAGAYSVKGALERSKIFENSDPGWKSMIKAHYGAISRGEYAAASTEARMVRFSKAPGMRNMATMGSLDEVRHGQIQLYFPHEHVSKDRQMDWAFKAYDTNEWAMIASRHFFDDIMMTRDAISVSIMLTFSFETGFTNMQFLGLAADAAEAGDHTFASLISSVQTDESRHAQIGGPALQVLIENGKKAEAQKKVDIAFWRAWKLFSVLTGPMMDYYTPLEHRKQSFKEFMEEWIVAQFERSLTDLGLDLPWYWDHFLEELGETHHGMHLGVWFWRPTVWWNPAAGVTPAEREWLEEKYPGWNDTWGQCWDVIIDNVVDGNMAMTDCNYFQMADSFRWLSHTAYRTKELSLAFADKGFAADERHYWETDTAWQGLRELMEKVLVTWDWAEAFVALNLVAKPAIDEAVLRKLGESARHNGDMLLGLLNDAQLIDAARHRRWATALVKMALEKPGNAEVIKGWIAKWEPLADKAIEAYGGALADVPDAAESAKQATRDFRRSLGL